MQFRDKFAFLSNMYYCPLVYQGDTYPCVETAFQISKCKYPGDADLFLDRKGYFVNGCTAKKIGRRVRLREDWEDVKDEIMLDILRSKFSNPRMRQALINTGDVEIVEDNEWGDTYWGQCRGVGENRLGKLLMKVREEVKE